MLISLAVQLSVQQVLCACLTECFCYKPSNALVQAQPLEGSLII